MFKQKGFSIVETLVALFSASIILGIMCIMFNNHAKQKTALNNSSKVMTESLVISERITSKLRYTSPSLITVYKNNKDDESFDAIGFPMLQDGSGYPSITPDKLGLKSCSYECLEDNGNLPKTWQSYVLYYYDKKDKNLYEITYKINYQQEANSEIKYVTALTKQPDVTTEIYDTSNLNNIISTGSSSMKKIGQNILSINAILNDLPSVKMNVSVSYGMSGSSGNSMSKIGTDENKTYEISNLSWTILPMN